MGAKTTGGTPPQRDTTWRVRDADGEDDAYFLQRQWHHWFGSDYKSQETIAPDLFPIADWTLSDDDDFGLIDAYGAIAEHAPTGRDASVRIGGGVVSHVTHDQTVEELPPGRFDPEALAGETNVWLGLNVVDGEWRGKGIGREILRRRMEWVRETDAEMAFVCGWERKRGRTSRPLLEQAGFLPVQRIEGMYAKTERPGCPDCGIWPSDNEPCTCDGTLWALDLGGAD